MSPTRSKYTADILARPGLTFDTEIRDPKQRIQAYMDAYKQNPPSKSIDESLLRDHLELIDASAGPQISASFRMRVSPEYCSRMGNMHGGLISLVFDLCTTMCAAPAARSNFWTFGGVSRTLNVTFLRSVRQGSWVRIHCELLHIGSRLCMTCLYFLFPFLYLCPLGCLFALACWVRFWDTDFLI
ncbi:hypothetical protein P168DRAFT_116012 [Aspergillus campestris IBT 28561]|uniref:Thioesterase domain-containing protein n=1 Tax=Aspergillus campestris (strain IBT 28561) TaxID=1392248 RepID=A0A2I1D9Q5_ASPC2|nr:uncharacterized protein P168DRAFT_116012 [Aspergillus campestris IBT 28561]PKY06605.1 hypothetical protein P168DRAFT_116012 [Aspergillus campestris IBT 28561]